MTQTVSKFVLVGVLCLLVNKINAGPWWTGPLLAPAGHTIPRGHTNLEVYAFITDVEGVYNSFGKVTHTPGDKNYVGNPLFSHGLTDKIDVQFSVPFSYNRNMDAHYHRISDVGATLGYQLLEQKQSIWPDLRVTLQEIIPTGRYEHLDPANNGSDSTGLGSYQTATNFNFQQQTHFSGVHYLRTRLSLGYVYANPVHIAGFSSYGGNALTDGKIRPGNMVTADLAGEFSLTQHWVAVMEGFASRRKASTFKGRPGIDLQGNPLKVGHDLSKQITLAPAVEYNFTSNIGIIAGIWFTLNGRDTAEFTSTVIALNAYW